MQSIVIHKDSMMLIFDSVEERDKLFSIPEGYKCTDIPGFFKNDENQAISVFCEAVRIFRT